MFRHFRYFRFLNFGRFSTPKKGTKDVSWAKNEPPFFRMFCDEENGVKIRVGDKMQMPQHSKFQLH